MPGYFRASGGTGPALTTTWLGTLPDRGLTFVSQNYVDQFNQAHWVSDVASNTINNWLPYNSNFMGGSNVPTATIGSAVAAPDGTLTAYELTETTSNTVHMVVGGWVDPNSGGGWNARFSVMAKAAGRTRFALYIGDGRFDQNIVIGTGARVVFDLAGGQVGVAPNNYGSATAFLWVPGPATIISYGNGWYRCTFDCFIGFANLNAVLACCIKLDNGSGTAAESTSYVGNGTSGVLFWKTSILPPKAFNLTAPVFFDDFTSLAKWDLANTQTDGFNWYLWGPWTNGYGFGTGDSNALTHSSIFSITGGTILNITPDVDPPAKSWAFRSISPQGANTAAYFGKAWQSPALFEVNVALPYWSTFRSFGSDAFWCVGAESITNQVGDGQKYIYIEDDFYEALYTPASTHWAGGQFSPMTGGTSVQGAPIWYSTFQYPNSITTVAYGGQLWTNSNMASLNSPPPAAPWTVITPGTAVDAYSAIDLTQFNTYSSLVLPASAGDPGHTMQFFNGKYCFNSHIVYGPGTPFSVPGFGEFAGNSFYRADNQHFPLFYGSSPTTPISTTTLIDWMRVTQ